MEEGRGTYLFATKILRHTISIESFFSPIKFYANRSRPQQSPGSIKTGLAIETRKRTNKETHFQITILIVKMFDIYTASVF